MEWAEDPHEELARELRWGPGAELRAEAETTELETHQGRLRKRTLHDVATQAMSRGDRVHATTAGMSLAGSIDSVGSDYLVIETASAIADAVLAACSLRFMPSETTGHSARPGSMTIRARISEYEHTGEEVRIIAPDVGVDVSGRIQVAASDHLILVDRDQQELAIPISKVAMIIRPGSN
jgi:hypothetical protein